MNLILNLSIFFQAAALFFKELAVVKKRKTGSFFLNVKEVQDLLLYSRVASAAGSVTPRCCFDDYFANCIYRIIQNNRATKKTTKLAREMLVCTHLAVVFLGIYYLHKVDAINYSFYQFSHEALCVSSFHIWRPKGGKTQVVVPSCSSSNGVTPSHRGSCTVL